MIVLTNVFGVEAASTLLLFKIEQDYWSELKTFMIYLNIIRDDEPALDAVAVDDHIWKTLESI